MAQKLITKLSDRPCPNHSSNPTAMICITCNDRYVCLECIATTHAGHRFWVLQKYIATQREKTISLLDKAKDKVKSGEERLKVIDKAKQGNNNFFNSVTKEIRDNENYWKNAIAKVSANYIAACKSNFDNNMGLLDSVKKTLQQRVEQLNQSLEICQNAVESKTYEDFAPLNEDIQKCIEREFELLPVLQQQTFAKPEATEKEIKRLCGEIWQSDWEPEEQVTPVILKNNDYEEPLPKPQLPSRPCPAIPKIPESIASSVPETTSEESQYVEIGAKHNLNLPLPIPALTIEKVGKTSVDLSWNRTGNYTIEKRRKGILKNWQKCADVSDLLTSYTVRDLKEGHEFQFRLVYVDEDSSDNQEKRTEPTKYVKLTSSDPDYEFSMHSATAQPLVPDKSPSYIERDTSGQKQIVCATAENIAKDEKELTYHKGDFIEIERRVYGSNEDTVWARNLLTGKSGTSNIKNNGVELSSDVGLYLEKRLCWAYHVEREEAESQLLATGVANGTFLLRLSTDKTNMVLSVRDDEKLKHYKICNTTEGYCIASRRYFSDVLDLIQFYQEKQEGLCQKLQIPLPQLCVDGLSCSDLEISSDTVTTTKKLGEGMFSTIYSGVLQDGGDVLVKEFRHGVARPHEFLKEVRHLKALKHPQLIQLIGVCLEKGPFFVTEFSGCGSVLECLRKDNGKTILLPSIVKMAGQIAGLMSYIGENGVVLTDLRLASWIVGKNLNIKLANLEFAESTTNGVFHGKEGRKFPIKWTAPEAVFSRTFSIKSDVWSFGIVLYELITFGKVPYQGMGGRELLTKIDTGYRMPRETDGAVHWPEDFYQIMQTCWEKVPDSRPSFEYLHSFFTNFYSKRE